MWLRPHLSFQQEVFLTFPNYGAFFILHLNDLAVQELLFTFAA